MPAPARSGSCSTWSQSPQAIIQDANDALWWTIVTMATVGYDDKYPVTLSGRVIAVFVMIVGVSPFSVLTSFMAEQPADHLSS